MKSLNSSSVDAGGAGLGKGSGAGVGSETSVGAREPQVNKLDESASLSVALPA